MVLEEQPGNPWYICGEGESFVISLGGAIQCGGSVWFTVLP